MTVKTATQLPGLSRSTACSVRGCHRLDGHKGACRTTLTVTAKTLVMKARRPKAASIVERGVEVASADRYAVQPDDGPVTGLPVKAGRVRIIPMADSPRLVADTSNGQFRTARRAGPAPQTTHIDTTVSQALGF